VTAILNPTTGRQLREVPDSTPAEVDAAFEAARAGLAEWKALAATERGAMLMRVADAMERRADEFARIESENMGMPLAGTRAMTLRAAGTFRYFGGYADKLGGETIPVAGPYHTYTRREPHGVVVAIVPWNAPLIFATKKMAPALAFGNACLLKPAQESPLTALLLGELLAEVGLPAGLARVLTGGRAVGEQLVGDPRADFVIFTGSHLGGKAVAAAAARNLTPVALELGGKSPQLVFADADLDAALDGVVAGIFGECGQMCIAGSRVLVDERIADRFVAELVERTRALRVGDPLQEGIQVGPQTTATQRDKTVAMIERARSEGAVVAAAAELPTDPELSGGYFVAPTLFTDVAPELEIAREEVFGPVLVAATFADEEEAVRLANDTPFGLSAGVWTTSAARAHRVAAAIDAGTIWLNTYAAISDLVPFGGIGLSGHGREGGSSAAQLYTRVKSVWTALTDGLPPGVAL